MKLTGFSEKITNIKGIQSVFGLSLLLLCFIYLDFTIKYTTDIPFSAYDSQLIFDNLILHLFSQTKSLLFIPLLTLLIWRRKNLFKSWTYLEHYKSIRLLAIVPVILLTWSYSTYSFNFFYNQSHLFDRLLLIALGIFIWRRPIFILPFILQLFSIIRQNDILPTSNWTEVYLLFHLVLLVFCYFLLYNVFRKDSFKILVPGLVVIYLSHYFPSGFFKLQPSWIFHDQVSSLLPSTYSAGWLQFIPIESIEKIAHFLSPLNPILRFFVVLFEFGCIVSLFRRKLFLTSIIGFILFHLGVLLLSGIFFWTWIVIGILLFYLFTKHTSFRNSFVLDRGLILVSVFFLLFSIPWKSFPALFWYNSPLGYAYQLEAIMDDGSSKTLMPEFFDPTYHYFAVQDYRFLNKEKRLGLVWGSTNKTVANFLRKVRTKSEILQYEDQNGHVSYNIARVKQLESYIQKFVINWNRNSRKLWLSRLKPPPIILTDKMKIFPSEKIIKINLIENTFLYQNGKLQTLRSNLLHTFTIEQ